MFPDIVWALPLMCLNYLYNERVVESSRLRGGTGSKYADDMMEISVFSESLSRKILQKKKLKKKQKSFDWVFATIVIRARSKGIYLNFQIGISRTDIRITEDDVKRLLKCQSCCPISL